MIGLWHDLLQSDQNIVGDPKSTLQEWAQARSLSIPHYSVISKTGPSHSPNFEVRVNIDDLEPEYGSGKAIKVAEKIAAEKMLIKVMGK